MDKDRDKLTNHDQPAHSEITRVIKSGWSNINIVDVVDHTEHGYFGGVYRIKSSERSYALKNIQDHLEENLIFTIEFQTLLIALIMSVTSLPQFQLTLANWLFMNRKLILFGY